MVVVFLSLSFVFIFFFKSGLAIWQVIDEGLLKSLFGPFVGSRWFDPFSNMVEFLLLRRDGSLLIFWVIDFWVWF